MVFKIFRNVFKICGIKGVGKKKKKKKKKKEENIFK